MRIYVQSLTTLSIYVLVSFLVATALLYVGRKKKRLLKTLSAIFFLAAFYGILSYTVLGRTPSDTHTFIFAATFSNEFYREMFMNALLYYPFGLTLTVLIGPWSILVSFLVSVAIESWQYLSGSGLVQGTDVIMNTLGAAIGSIPWFVVRCILKYKKASKE